MSRSRNGKARTPMNGPKLSHFCMTPTTQNIAANSGQVIDGQMINTPNLGPFMGALTFYDFL